MTNGRASGGPGVYEIRVRRTLDHKWADWFDGLAIAPNVMMGFFWIPQVNFLLIVEQVGEMSSPQG